jgi:hypothetical protein
MSIAAAFPERHDDKEVAELTMIPAIGVRA